MIPLMMSTSRFTNLVPRLLWTLGISFLAIACTQTGDQRGKAVSGGKATGKARASNGELYEHLEIVTLLPRDAIPAIDDPEFLAAEEANESYDEDEMILGVEFNGDARAYSIPLLSSHEIVNDTVGGVKIAVTW